MAYILQLPHEPRLFARTQKHGRLGGRISSIYTPYCFDFHSTMSSHVSMIQNSESNLDIPPDQINHLDEYGFMLMKDMFDDSQKENYDLITLIKMHFSFLI
jgi:hypothetical protein